MRRVLSQSSPDVFSYSIGRGPNLVLLHGWGMNGGIFDVWSSLLSDSFKVIVVDLPGHGRSGPFDGDQIEELASLVVSELPAQFHLLGWSLGGLIGMNISRDFPDRVLSLGLVASTPCFFTNHGWPGIDLDMLHKLSHDLSTDASATLERFAGLQNLGLADSRRWTKSMVEMIHRSPFPNSETLKVLLLMLGTLDFREEFSALADGTYLIQGKKDRLVPFEVIPLLKDLNSLVEVDVIPDAGHVPFLTHPERCACYVKRMLLSKPGGVLAVE